MLHEALEVANLCFLLLALGIEVVQFGHQFLLGLILAIEDQSQLRNLLFVKGKHGFVLLLKEHDLALEGLDHE